MNTHKKLLNLGFKKCEPYIINNYDYSNPKVVIQKPTQNLEEYRRLYKKSEGFYNLKSMNYKLWIKTDRGYICEILIESNNKIEKIRNINISNESDIIKKNAIHYKKRYEPK